MTRNKDIQEELKQVAPELARLNPGMSFRAPEGYFDQLTDQLLMHIKTSSAQNAADEATMIAPIFNSIKNITPYQVPEGYFDGLTDWILLRIKAEESGSVQEETAILSPLLGGMKKMTPYSVPSGYFDQKPEIPVSATETQAKVVNFPVRRTFRYAAAAVAVGIILSAGYFFMNSNPPVSGQIALNGDSLAEQHAIQNIVSISDTEIAGFVEGYPAVAPAELASATAEIGSDDITLILSDVSDKELENYVAGNGALKENFN